MRYSYVTPRIQSPLATAREAVGAALKSGAVRDLDAAYQQLESATRLAAARRASNHHMRTVTRILGTPDPTWERMCAAVEGFRK